MGSSWPKWPRTRQIWCVKAERASICGEGLGEDSVIARTMEELRDVQQVIGHACVALDEPREAWSRDALGARSVRTDPLAHEQLEVEMSSATCDICNSARISAMDP